VLAKSPKRFDSLAGIGPVTTELSLSPTGFSSDSTLAHGGVLSLNVPALIDG
jgi:hypothetical protein